MTIPPLTPDTPPESVRYYCPRCDLSIPVASRVCPLCGGRVEIIKTYARLPKGDSK